MPDHVQRPYLVHDVRVFDSSDVVTLEQGDHVYTVTGTRDAERTASAIRDMHGTRSLGELAERHALDVAGLGRICAALETEGLVIDTGALASDATSIDVATFLAQANERFAAWKQRLFSHPLWASLADGTAPRSVFLGWLIENYHLIAAVMARLPLAISRAETREARQHLSRHFREEYDHFHFFERSLTAAGLPPERVARLRPLPGTMAVIHHMRGCARRDTLSYAACSGFLESTGEDHARSRAFFDCMASHFDGPDAPIVTPLGAHAALDEDYGHCGMLELIARSLGPISQGRATQALADAYALVETLELWSTDMLRHYHATDLLLPTSRRYRPVAAYEVCA